MFVFSSAIQTSPPVGGEKKSDFTTLFYRFPLILSTPKIPCGPRSVTGTPSNTVTPNPKIPATPIPPTPLPLQNLEKHPRPPEGVWLLLPRPFHPVSPPWVDAAEGQIKYREETSSAQSLHFTAGSPIWLRSLPNH